MRRAPTHLTVILLIVSLSLTCTGCWGCMNRVSSIFVTSFWKAGARRMSTTESNNSPGGINWSLNQVLALSAVKYGRFGQLQRRPAEVPAHEQKAIRSDQTCHLVVGNQACDADSIISAISYAYVKQIETIHRDDVPIPSGNSAGDAIRTLSHIYAPIISCMREDFVLRREATYLLQLAGVDTSLLTFLDDLDFEKWESTVNSGSGEKVRFPRGALTLVDHNAPEGPFTSAYWYDATEEIVDHHRDDGKVTHVTGAARNISFDESVGKGVGSTCTLVASAAKSTAPFVLKQEPALIKVLMGTILLDTVNCSESAGKTTSQDKTIVQELKELLPSEANFEPDEVFSELLRQKSDPKFWASLTPRQCLQYDYKCVFAGLDGSINIGISSILKPIEHFLEMNSEDGSISSQTIQSMENFAEERHLSLVVVMSAVFEPEMKRQALLFDPSRNGPSQIFDLAKSALESSETLQLSSHSMVANRDQRLIVWDQKNTKASRKALAPILVDAVGR